MIVRSWKGRVHPGRGPDYLAFLEGTVFPEIRALPGNLGARALRSVEETGDDFLVLTEWVDLEAVTSFAGPDPGVAVVPDEARALLADYDARVEHFELVLEAE